VTRLRRITGEGWIGGVCAGIGYWLGVPTWLVRLVWVVLIFAYGFGVGIYLLLWIFMPRWPDTPPDYAGRAGG
jgi:phage shock protein PspC (stress-responsive transcriptional regulator)